MPYYLLFLILAVSMIGCTGALPVGGRTAGARNNATTDEIASYVERAEKAASEARAYHHEVVSMRLRVEALRNEAKELSQKAKESENKCKVLAKRSEKSKTHYKVRPKKKSGNAGTADGGKDEQPPAIADKRKPEYPKYSPSDAPEGWHE